MRKRETGGGAQQAAKRKKHLYERKEVSRKFGHSWILPSALAKGEEEKFRNPGQWIKTGSIKPEKGQNKNP